MGGDREAERKRRLAQALRANLRERKRSVPGEDSAMRKREDALAPRIRRDGEPDGGGGPERDAGA